MATFTLTPDNAHDRPDNVLHIIVQEGVTEIAKEMFYWHESLETVVMAKSVTIIHAWAFAYCVKLKSIVFPNDSQLQEIRREAFAWCDSLQTIVVPDNVTIIASWGFAFCSNLKKVIFKHSLLRKLGQEAFHGCTMLQFINLPGTVIEIGLRVFYCCQSLQVIALPHQAQVHPSAFKQCDALQSTFNQQGSLNCIKRRFDLLPIHQLSYDFHQNNKVDEQEYFLTIKGINDPLLLQEVDIMGMTPLHILCANPMSTVEMIKQLYNKNRGAANMTNVKRMTPWHMFLVGKGIMTYKQFVSIQYGEESNDVTEMARILVGNGEGFDVTYIHDMISLGVDYDIFQVTIVLHGSSIELQSDVVDETSGLFPFMSIATSYHYKLSDVYDVAIRNVSCVVKLTKAYHRE